VTPARSPGSRGLCNRGDDPRRRPREPGDHLPFRATALGGPYDAIHSLPVVFILENVRSLYNVGAFFRTADALRLEALWLAGITASPPDRRIAKTALGSEDTVPWRRWPDAAAAVNDLRARGFEIAALDTVAPALDLFEWQPRFPVAVVFGHEVDGIRPDTLERADVRVRIPMLGAKRSLNVATAGGVVGYELLRRCRRGPTAG
jgi:tRNA G18 (ribose-2'-O)-methylase SpoU